MRLSAAKECAVGQPEIAKCTETQIQKKPRLAFGW